jgi:hypothetical protein
MTAITGFDRLECTGLWRPAPDQMRREVVVTFGNATLVISDTAGRPQAHWSLAALRVKGEGSDGTLFTADDDGDEALELADPTMLQAIARVQVAIAAARVRPGRLRRRIIAGASVLLAGAVLWFLPGALTRQMITALPDARLAELGAILLGQMQAQSAPTCRAPQGVAAAGRLADRLWPGQGWQIVVLPQGLVAPQALPGDILLLPADLLTEARDPAVVAGHLIAATQGDAPAERLFADSGLWAVFRIVTQGALPDGDLAPQATTLLAAPAPAPDAGAMQAALLAAEVPYAPWADSVGLDPGPAGTALPPVISDSDWIALQAICAT